MRNQKLLAERSASVIERNAAQFSGVRALEQGGADEIAGLRGLDVGVLHSAEISLSASCARDITPFLGA